MFKVPCSLEQALDFSTWNEPTKVVQSCNLPKTVVQVKAECSLPLHWKRRV